MIPEGNPMIECRRLQRDLAHDRCEGGFRRGFLTCSKTAKRTSEQEGGGQGWATFGDLRIQTNEQDGKHFKVYYVFQWELCSCAVWLWW